MGFVCFGVQEGGLGCLYRVAYHHVVSTVFVYLVSVHIQDLAGGISEDLVENVSQVGVDLLTDKVCVCMWLLCTIHYYSSIPIPLIHTHHVPPHS